MPVTRTSFQKGVSGNPGGRPKGPTKEMAAFAREFGVPGIAMLAELAGLTPGKVAEPDAARVAAIRELLDRGFGKATQILAGDDERPISVSFEWAPAQPKEPVDTIEHTTTVDAQPDALQLVWSGKDTDE